MIIGPKPHVNWEVDEDSASMSRKVDKPKCELLKRLLKQRALLRVSLDDERAYVGTFVGTDRKGRILLSKAVEYLPAYYTDSSSKRRTLYSYAYDRADVSNNLWQNNTLESDIGHADWSPIQRNFRLIVLPGGKIKKIEVRHSV